MICKLKKIIFYFFHPNMVIEKIKWLIQKKKLKKCGKNSFVGKFFSIKGSKYISIGTNTRIGRFAIISAYDSYRGAPTGFIPNLDIGNNVSVMNNCLISCANFVRIDDGVLLGDNVFITDNYHGDTINVQFNIPPIERKICIKGKVHIGKNVWVGRNVCIMPDVEIGDGSIIGANSVVTHNVPPYCVVAGSPATIIRRNNISEVKY